jgi:hypothetical protein
MIEKLLTFLKWLYKVLVQTPIKLVRYTKARLMEKSTWAAVATGVTAAAALSQPYSYAIIAISVIMAILPTSSTDAPSTDS